MRWEEINTVRDFRTFRKGSCVMTIFHGLHEDLFNVIIEEEDRVTRNLLLTEIALWGHYDIKL